MGAVAVYKRQMRHNDVTQILQLASRDYRATSIPTNNLSKSSVLPLWRKWEPDNPIMISCPQWALIKKVGTLYISMSINCTNKSKHFVVHNHIKINLGHRSRSLLRYCASYNLPVRSKLTRSRRRASRMQASSLALCLEAAWGRVCTINKVSL